MDGFATMLQIRIVTMFAARDSGVNTCNLQKIGVNDGKNGNWCWVHA